MEQILPSALSTHFTFDGGQISAFPAERRIKLKLNMPNCMNAGLHE